MWGVRPVIYPYSCFWALPEQSLWGPSSAKLTTIFYCLIRDSPNLEGQVPVFTCISPRNRMVQLYHRALGCFSSLLTTRRATMYSNLPPLGCRPNTAVMCRPHRRHQFRYCCMRVRSHTACGRCCDSTVAAMLRNYCCDFCSVAY
jgi:hypothetical protein